MPLRAHNDIFIFHELVSEGFAGCEIIYLKQGQIKNIDLIGPFTKPILAVKRRRRDEDDKLRQHDEANRHEEELARKPAVT